MCVCVCVCVQSIANIDARLHQNNNSETMREHVGLGHIAIACVEFTIDSHSMSINVIMRLIMGLGHTSVACVPQ